MSSCKSALVKKKLTNLPASYWKVITENGNGNGEALFSRMKMFQLGKAFKFGF